MSYETKGLLPLRNILSLGGLLTNVSGVVCTRGASHTVSPMLLRVFSAEPFYSWASTTSHERRTCPNVPALQFLVWSACPCCATLTLAMLWWEWQTKTCDLPLSLKLRTWPLLGVYQGKFLPPERFLYISEVEGQLDLGKNCLPLKQLVVWTEPVLSQTAQEITCCVWERVSGEKTEKQIHS